MVDTITDSDKKYLKMTQIRNNNHDFILEYSCNIVVREEQPHFFYLKARIVSW